MADEIATIIDWVDSSAGDIRADIAMDLADIYLWLYCQKSGLSKE